MEIDRGAEWQRLREHYGAMDDEDLLRLGADFANLTEIAQQVLRDELRVRGLGDPTNKQDAVRREELDRGNPLGWTSEAALAEAEAAARERRGLVEDEPEKITHEYTWKTLLCECVDYDHAWQTYEVLRRAGIESWIEPSRAQYRDTPRRVMVAADEFERAKKVASQPVPPDILEESQIHSSEIPDFEPPKCPRCSAADPILIESEPGNAWECEACGHEWAEAAEVPEEK